MDKEYKTKTVRREKDETTWEFIIRVGEVIKSMGFVNFIDIAGDENHVAFMYEEAKENNT
jgi:hypothetical protein